VNKFSVLNDVFGYSSFRPGQEEAIDAVLSGTDVLAVMPTGAGKSLCYQIPALMMEGMTIVISPLISLMKDQVTALKETGCAAVFLNSSLTNEEYAAAMNEINSGRIKLLYIAPERLQRTEIYSTLRLQSAVKSEPGSIKVPLVVIDEAHCVSQWGHDFRTSYLQIADFIGGIAERPVVAAFTATATVKVREDIKKSLALRNAHLINTGFDRPNLYFEVQKPKDKKAALLECLDKRKNSSGIIYCATRKSVEEICNLLISRGFNAARYHAGLDDAERRKNQEDFIYDRKTIMVATNAFGMGIDKSNVSFVIHYNMPKNMESYYQEAGRAGRDGASADCILLYNGQDVRINQFLITHGGDENNEEDRSYQEKQNKLVEHNLELLKQMTFYAAGNDCLRRRLLAYFGENTAANCGNCSNCLNEYTETDITIEAQKIASCVFRLKQRGKSFGRTMIIDILRGSKNEKIRRFGFDTLSTYGLLSDTSAHRIRLIMDYLTDKNILKMEDGEFPVITLGGTENIFNEDCRLFMKLPHENDASGGQNKPSPTGARENTGGSNQKTQISSSDVDDELFEKLRMLRKEIAGREAVPAYIVFSDAALKDMSRKKPVSPDQFSAVNGVGAVKLEKYGEEFTSFIKKHIEE